MRPGSEKDAGLLHVRNAIAHVARAAKNDPTLFSEVVLPEDAASADTGSEATAQ